MEIKKFKMGKKYMNKYLENLNEEVKQYFKMRIILKNLRLKI